MPNFSYLSKHWDIYTYPWRPNSFFLNEIDKYILSEKLDILILGSTKEFRFNYRSHNITICDMSFDMIKANDIWNINETIIIEDWLKMDDKKYDIILWDLIFFLLDNVELKLLLDKINGKLTKNWKFIFRTVFPLISYKEDLIINNFNRLKNHKFRFNYLTFELVIWKKYVWKDISDFIKKHNLDFIDFSENFQKFTPYNTSKINIEIKSNFDILLRDFNVENLISKKFVFCQECIYVISNKNA